MSPQGIALRWVAAVAVFSLLALCAAPSRGEAERSDPAAALTSLLELFREIERSCEGGRWREAEKQCVEITKAFYEMVPEPDDAEVKELYFNFGRSLGRFEVSLRNRDLEGIERDSIPLQQVFFGIMEQYDYDVPPPLVFMDKDLKKAVEAAGEGDLAEVEHEMLEVSAFFLRAQVSLRGKGVPEEKIHRCGETIREVESAVKGKDLTTAAAGLADLDDQTGHFIRLYRPAR